MNNTVSHAIYIISMSTATERRTHIAKQFGEQSIPFEFFDALTPSEALQDEIDTHIPNLNKTWLSPGEKGCFMSHLLLWQKCIEEKIDYLFVFEDDVILSKQAHLFLRDSKWLEERFSGSSFILRLEGLMLPVYTRKTGYPSYEGRSFRRLCSRNYGTAGYVISLKAAECCYEKVTSLATEDLDAIDELIFGDFLQEKSFTVYQMIPAVCVQEAQLKGDLSPLGSDLELARKNKWKCVKEALDKGQTDIPERYLRMFVPVHRKKANILVRIWNRLHRIYLGYQVKKKYVVVPFE